VALALIGMFGPHDGSVLRVPAALAAKAEDALARAGNPGVEVHMDGQHARLIGVAPTSDDVKAAGVAVLRAAGAGGPWAGGVTGVDVSRVREASAESPLAWRIVRRGRAITLSGAAPSAEAAAELEARAIARIDGAAVTNTMRTAVGAPSPRWRAVALDAVDQIARLANGEARLTGERLVILGEGDEEAVEAVRVHYAQPLPAPFTAATDLIVSGQALAIPELGGLDLVDADSFVCGEAFSRLMADYVINFASGSASVAPESLPLLRNLASVALRCDRFTIEIAGHTDNEGARALNLDLSQRRADAVAAYLVDLNVARDRLVTVGYGPDQPVASNATPAGQAANRRIAFSVRE
jgi:OOP family OmpA-OmpF porin